MSNRQHFTRIKNYRIHVQHYYETLEQHRSKDNKQAFYEVYLRIIPQLKNYIKTRLQELVHAGHFPHNFYEVDDFVDDLFISVYDNFKEFKSEEDFYMFLFKEMDRLLKNVARTEEELHQPLENIEVYAKAERDQLREKMTAQLDGDLILKQELDDVSYASQHLASKTLSEETTEDTIVNTIDIDFTRSLSTRQIDTFIRNLPLVARNVATLYIHFHLTISEIMNITKETQHSIEMVIDQVSRLRNTKVFY